MPQWTIILFAIIAIWQERIIRLNEYHDIVIADFSSENNFNVRMSFTMPSPSISI